MSNTGKQWLFAGVTLALLAGVFVRRVVLPGRTARLHAPRTAQLPRGSPAAPTAAVPPGEVGTRLPEFHFKDISGREISSEELRGKIVLIDFWATWCGPCKVEMPGYQILQERYGDRGLVVIGLALDTDSAAVSRFAKKLGVNYTLALSTAEVQQAFGGILGIPTTILVDREGIIRQKIIGFEYTEAFESAIKELL